MYGTRGKVSGEERSGWPRERCVHEIDGERYVCVEAAM